MVRIPDDALVALIADAPGRPRIERKALAAEAREVARGAIAHGAEWITVTTYAAEWNDGETTTYTWARGFGWRSGPTERETP